MNKVMIKVLNKLIESGYDKVTNMNFWQAGYKGDNLVYIEFEILLSDGSMEDTLLVGYDLETGTIKVW